MRNFGLYIAELVKTEEAKKGTQVVKTKYGIFIQRKKNISFINDILKR